MITDQAPPPADAVGSFVTGLRRWSENMSATGRRAATSVAASKGRQWVNRTLDFKPSRGEVRAWFELVLDERRGLHNRVEALVKENEALAAQRDAALEELAETGRLRFEVEGLEQTVAHVCRARDEALEECVEWRRRFDAVEHELDTIQAQRDDAREEERCAREASTMYCEDADRLCAELAAVRAQQAEALEGYREDVEHFRGHVETLDADRTRRTRERDTAERNLHERTVEMTKRYEELRAAYDQAEAERNELARACARLHGELDGRRERAKVGRAAWPHTTGGGAE